MKSLLAATAALFALFIFIRADVHAAPVIPSLNSGSAITLVAQGCGRGFHRNRVGGCSRNLSARWPCFWRRGPLGRWHLICR